GLAWGRANKVRPEILQFVEQQPERLYRPAPDKPSPFSTPRAWASLGNALDRVEAAGRLTPSLRLALAVGRLSLVDAQAFCQAGGFQVPEAGKVTVTLSEAKTLIQHLASAE